jgi:ABC-type phosphate/phosphonate transport system substrate-binding protein
VIGDADAVKVGVLAIRSAVAANSQYGPVVEYLEDELGRSFELVPLGQDDIFDAVATGEIDFVMSNPLSSVQISRLYGTEFIGTLDRDSTGPEFGGIIIVRDDSDIIDLADLRGRDVTCVAFQTAAAGCNFQVLHLLEAGVAPDDFGSFTETPSQDNIVLAVLNGDVDAGFVRTGQLERMVADGILLDTSELRILDQQASDYVFPHTTRLYPEWPFAALAATDDELVEAVSAALLGLDADSEAAEALGAVGFVEPLDYGPLSDLVVELQLRSWDAPDS